MYILTLEGREDQGAYSVTNEEGRQVLYLFEEEDDCDRFAMMLEERDNTPDLNVLEVDDNLIVKTCQLHGYEYAVITKNDLVIPPEDDNI
mgnify:CR=1 FL=1